MIPGEHGRAAEPIRPSQSRVQRWRRRAKPLTFRRLVWELRRSVSGRPHVSSMPGLSKESAMTIAMLSPPGHRYGRRCRP